LKKKKKKKPTKPSLASHGPFIPVDRKNFITGEKGTEETVSWVQGNVTCTPGERIWKKEKRGRKVRVLLSFYASFYPTRKIEVLSKNPLKKSTQGKEGGFFADVPGTLELVISPL